MKSKLLILLFLASLTTYAQTNLVPNGGFETWTNSTTLSNWTVKNTVSQNTSSYTEGIKSAQLSIANSTTKPEIKALVPMKAGTTYTVKFKYKYVSANYSGDHPISLNISQNGSSTTLSSSTFATNNNWTVKETTFTPDQNMSYDLSISLYTFDAAAFNVLIDDVQVYIQGTEQYTLIPDLNFENKLIALGIDSGATDRKVLTNSINNVAWLNVSNSSIVDLTGIQDFVGLKTLDCDNNKFTTLDVSKNVNLINLNVSYSQIKSLDVSKNTALKSLNCRRSSFLAEINLKNGSNTLIAGSDLKLTETPSLACVLVDNIAFSNTNWVNSKDSWVNYSDNCTTPKYTLIPDINFEKALISAGFDGPLDGKVLTARIEAVKILEYNYSNYQSITDLTGIQDFKALEVLKTPSAKLTTPLDVSKNLALKTLECSFNQLTTLDVSNNIALTTLDCSFNNLTSISVSANLNLTEFKCSENDMTSIDVSKNTALTKLFCGGNQIPNIDIRSNNSLLIVNCGANKLTSLDVSKNTALTSLSCYQNKLTTLDLSYNKVLTNLNCKETSLSNLDISQNTSLISLDATNNSILTSVNLKNGKNTLLTTLNLKDNTSLSCILVDDITYSNANWANKDVWANYSLICTEPKYTLIPDVEFEKALIAEKIDAILDGKILSARAAVVKTLDFYQKYSEISDFTGIEDFISLETLKTPSFSYYQSKLVKMDLSKNSALKTLVSNYTKLTSIDLSKNTFLINVEINNNSLLSELNLKNQNNNLLTEASLNLKNNGALSCILVDDSAFSNTNWVKSKDIWVTYSQICGEPKFTLIPDVEFEKVLINSGLDNIQDGKVLTARIAVEKSINYGSTNYNKITDLTGIEDFTALESLTTPNVNLGKLNVSKNTALKTLKCSSNQLTSLDVTNLKNLTYLDCSNNKLTVLNINDNIALKTLNTSYNLLTKLDPSNNISLTILNSYYNTITDLNTSKNTALETLNCGSNQLTSLDISNNIILKELIFNENKLNSLDVSKNTALTKLICYSNQLSSLDISKNLALSVLECSSNRLTNLDVSRNVALTRLISGNSSTLQSLNLKNGKNTLITNSNISLSSTPNLYCILVDDVTYSNANWATKKDATATFNSVECKAFSLPANNFNVESKGETCLNTNNGEINITATANYTYKAKINTGSYTFTNNSLKVTNLTPGTYTISITIPGENFEQSFTIVIPKGATITGKSSVVANKVAVEITEGTAPYTVFVDGVEQFETTDANFTIVTKNGGLLQVKTAKACEGIYAKEIARLDGAIAAYPNPTSGSFEIELPTAKKEVAIALYTLDGHLISTKTYTVENGKAQLSLENQPAGVYVAKIELDTPDYLKIIKN
jgi:Leucine-rich repeat (LRR) protein